MEPSLSLALIVRDEAEYLPACLDCFEQLAPEICIVDTGSTDATVEIAAARGARVHHVPWSNDFASARNASLELCTRPWIFVIDADERLAAVDLPRFRDLLNGPLDTAYRFVTRNYTSNPNISEFEACMPDDAYALGFAGWFPSTKVRLFPNRSDVRFEGIVHELVNPSLQQAQVSIQTSDIPVHHYPLLKSAESHARKAALYVELGRAKVKLRPDDPKAHVELGNQLAEARDYAGAAAAYRHALKLQPASPDILKDLGAVLHLLNWRTEAQTALELAVRLRPDFHDGWRNLGVVHAAAGEWDRAVRCFRHALRLFESWYDGHRFLSIALQNSGKPEEAIAEAKAAVEYLPESIDAASHYVDLMLASRQHAAACDLLDTLLVVRPKARGWRYGRERLDGNHATGPADAR